MPSSFHGLAEEEVNPNTEINVRESARLQPIGDGQGFVKCSCQTGCARKTCKCVRSNVLCNSRCHNKGRSPFNCRLYDFSSLSIHSQISFHRKFEK